jgi:CheY-like chemotaxis protein
LIDRSFNGRARVLRVVGGTWALRMALVAHPDVIVCDYRMPVLGGPSLIRYLRNDPTLRRVPVVLYSAEPRLAALARMLDVQGSVDKLDILQLPDEVRRVLARGYGLASA